MDLLINITKSDDSYTRSESNPLAVWLYTTLGSCQIASRTCCSAFRI